MPARPLQLLVRPKKSIRAWRRLLAAAALWPAWATAVPLSSAAYEPSGDWLDASVAVESVEREHAFPGLGLRARLSEEWQAGIRLPFESATANSRWSDARRHGELAAIKRFTLVQRLHGSATVGAGFNSGETSQHPHLITGSLLGLRVSHAATPWRNAVGVTLQQFEPRRDGSRPGDIWSLRVATGRFAQRGAGRWFAGAALDGELYLPGTDAEGADTADGSIWFVGANLAFEHRRWRITGALQVAVADALPETEDSAAHRVQLQVSYGLGGSR